MYTLYVFTEIVIHKILRAIEKRVKKLQVLFSP